MQYNVRAHDNVRAYASAAKVQVRSNCTSCAFHASGARGTVADLKATPLPPAPDEMCWYLGHLGARMTRDVDEIV